VKPAPNTFTNADWNNWAETKAQELGDSAPIKVLYSASKVAAERAVWKFRNEHKVRPQSSIIILSNVTDIPTISHRSSSPPSTLASSPGPQSNSPPPSKTSM